MIWKNIYPLSKGDKIEYLLDAGDEKVEKMNGVFCDFGVKTEFQNGFTKVNTTAIIAIAGGALKEVPLSKVRRLYQGE